MKRVIVYASLVSSCALSMSPAFADDRDDMRAEIAALRKRLEELEKKLDQPGAQPSAPMVPDKNFEAAAAPPPEARPSNAAVVAGLPGSFQIPGTDSAIRIFGHVRLGAYKDLNDNLNSYKFVAGNIHPLNDAARSQTGNIQSQLKLSRIGVDTLTPTNWGPLRTVLTADFAGSEAKSYQAEALQNNGFHLRLTHAYATIGPHRLLGVDSIFLLGQTWSNFVDDPDSAETLEASGPADVPTARQPQLRYLAETGGGVISVSLENPIGDYQLAGTPFASSVNNTSTTNKVPDLTIKYEIQGDWGRAQISGLSRRFDINDGEGHRASTSGTGLILGGTINLFGSDRLGGQIWHGNGIGRYIPDDFGTPNAFAVDKYGTQDIAAQGQMMNGGSLWYRRRWNRLWRTNLAFGYNRERFAPFILPASDQAEVLKTMHLNLIFTPLPQLDLGLELEYGRKKFRESLKLRDADAKRITFGSKVTF